MKIALHPNMSDKISKLNIDRTIKEYDYLKSEYDYIVIISDEADKDFMSVINSYLEKKPALKEIYESKEKKIIDDNFNKIKNKVFESRNDELEENIELPKKKSNKSKTLYRQIVKETHPDKVNDDRLNEFYIKATDSYNNDDAASLYAICSELGIAFGVNEDDLVFFNENINRIKGEINLLKQTYAYEWSQAVTEDDKNKILLKFVKFKIK